MSLSQVLSTTVVAEEYAIDIASVREIVRWLPLTRVPAMPAAIRGVCNLRGRVVPIIDLSRRLGLGDTVIGAFTCIVIVDLVVEGEPLNVGLLVDEVNEVVDV